MARFLIADMQSTGHHARYVRWIIESEVMRKVEVILAGPKSLLDHEELAPMREAFIPQEVDTEKVTASLLAESSFVGLLRKQLAFRSLYARAVLRAKESGAVNLVILPAADDALDAWAVLGTGFKTTPWVGISMRPVFHFRNVRDVVAPSRRDDWVRARLYRKLLRDQSLRTLMTIDPTMIDFASSSFSPGERNRLTYVPDPSFRYELPTRASSRAELGIPGEAQVVLLYGSLTERKGIIPLIHAASAPRCPRSVHVLLAGRQDGGVKRFLQQIDAKALRTAGRLHVLETYLDDRLERMVLSAADFMWLGYTKFYRMSSVLVLATRHGLPSIFTREGVVGYMGRKFGLGPEIDPENLDTVIQTLSTLPNLPYQYEQSVAEAQERFEVHSLEHFQSVISQVAVSAASLNQPLVASSSENF